MTYEEALQRLSTMGPELRVATPGDTTPASGLRRKFTLDHIRSLLHALGDPQKTFASVLIAGTNGKGSTASTLASIATAAGLKTGLYTSPHLVRVNERMRISSPQTEPTATLAEIPDDAFASVFDRVDDCSHQLVDRGDLPHYPSYFELMTAIAFCWFAQQQVELAILEVGLGGRLDATNSVEPIISVITDIGIDHTEYLGNTLREIATEKAGILRPNGVLVTLSQHPDANASIGEAAMRLDVRGVDAARCLPGVRHGASIREPDPASPLERNRYDLSIDGDTLHIDSPLAGQHQQRNVALAVATAIELRTNHRHNGQAFNISNAAIEQGVRSTQWPGRLEWITARHGHAPLLLDVAHNPAGAWTLRAALAQLPDAMPRTLIFSCLADKQIDEMAQVLLPLFDSTSGDPARSRDHVILAPIQNPRAATVDALLAAAHRLDVPAHAAPHLPGALAQAEAVTPPDGVIVATGSVFLVGELRALALGEPLAPDEPR